MIGNLTDFYAFLNGSKYPIQKTFATLHSKKKVEDRGFLNFSAGEFQKTLQQFYTTRSTNEMTEIKMSLFLCAMSSLLVVVSASASACDEAKKWLVENKEGLKYNNTETWRQMKTWISGNEVNCLKSLANDTAEAESLTKIYEVLKKDVFQDLNVQNKTSKKGCSKNCGKGKRKTNRKQPNKNRKQLSQGSNNSTKKP